MNVMAAVSIGGRTTCGIQFIVEDDDDAPQQRRLRWSSRYRLARVAVAALLGAALLTACDPPTATTTFVVGATATANEPAVAVTDAEEKLMERAAKVGFVHLTAFVGSTSTSPVIDNRDISTYYDKTSRELQTDPSSIHTDLEANLAPVEKQLSTAASTEPDLDLLGLLDLMAEVHGPATLFVHSSGLQTVNPLDLRPAGSDLDVDATVAAVPKGLLPNLHGKRVVFVGLGQVAGRQQQLTPGMITAVEKMWLGICRRAGGTCDSTVLTATGNAPVATTTVPTIPVPAAIDSVKRDHASQLQPGTYTVNLPTGALFVPDTATYLPNAEALVRSQAAEFEPDTGSIPVSASATGHCATWGNAADARTLSLQRAQKVVATLVAAGVSRSLFTTISGVGFDQLVVPDLTSGNVLIPDKAELNRTVVLTVKRVGRTQ